MKKLLKKSIATVLAFSLVSSIYSESATIAFADMDNSTSSSSGKFEDANKNDINNEDKSEGDSGHSEIVFDSYEKSKEELKSIREKKLAELEDNKGTYNENKIVLYNTNKSDAKMLAEKLGAKLRISFDNRFATLTLDKKTIYDVISDDANLKYVEAMSPDYYNTSVSETEYHTYQVPNRFSDDKFDEQNYLKYVNIGSAWDCTLSNMVTVAVIDTGIDTDHSEFIGKISEYSYNATEDKIVKDYTLADGSYDWSIIEDEQGHGTAVAGVIAASSDNGGVVGIAPNVNLLVIKAECDENGEFYSVSDLVFGLYYAIEQDVDIVNMSFGTEALLDPFAEAVALAMDSDIVCVAAAGNKSTATAVYPAANPDVIGVGALEDDEWTLAEYSNYGENLNMVAPGTTMTSSVGGYQTMLGTSFACPIVAGAVALYKAKNGYTTCDEVKERLYASCMDMGDAGYDMYYGYGALDINAFVCEEAGKVTFDMLTDELSDIENLFIRNHTLQNIPEPERNYAVFEGWYYDIDCTEPLNLYEDKFTADLTLYAKWINEDDGVPYTYVELDDGTIEIRSYTGHRRYITIPEKIDGKIVSSIGVSAFENEERLRQINLPSGLVNIRDNAFAGCTSLVNMSIPARVKEIGKHAFFNCTRMSAVIFGEGSSLEKIDEFAFSNTKLERITLPGGLKEIYGSSFFGASYLKNIAVDNPNTSYTAIDGVLLNGEKTTIIAYPAAKTGDSNKIPDGVSSIGDYAFGYAKLKSVSLSGITEIGKMAFAYSKLGSITIPDSVVSMGGSTFFGCDRLASVKIGRGFTEIPVRAFALCNSLVSVNIPANITALNREAFKACASLKSVTFAENSKLNVIGSSAFACCTSLEAIKMPASVCLIGGSAFFNCSLLSDVTFAQDSVLSAIDEKAFTYTSSLKKISLPESLVSIGNDAFFESAIESIFIPENVSTIGSSAFGFCVNLENISVDDKNTTYCDIDGVLYTVDKTKIIAYPAGNVRASYTIKNTVTTVAGGAFYGSVYLTEINLPSKLINIEDYAFADNYSLLYIKIPDTVYTIGRYAFAGNMNMQSVYFTENATLPRISFAAFAQSGITDICIPASVSTVAQYAFEGCDNLLSITFAQNSKLSYIPAFMFIGCDTIKNITFESGSALTNIEAHGFEGMANLSSIDFGGAKIDNIDNYAFRFCTSLSDITLPDTVEFIGRFAFYGCESLSELSLGEKISYIGSNAFYKTNNLNIYFKSDTLPATLAENWDSGLTGYYLGVSDVMETEEYKYAKLTDGNIAIIKYKGTASAVDLSAVKLGGNITQIGGYAFNNSAVTSITLPSSLEMISRYAFADTAIKTISIPQSVYFIGKYAFANSDIASVTFAGTSKLEKIEQYAFYGCKNLTSFAVPSSVEIIETAAFAKSGLKTVDLTKSTITKIYPRTFEGAALNSVTIPDSVTYIDDNAFRDCLSLAEVTFGKGKDLQIHANVFYNSGLENVNIPANVTYIGEYAFVGLVNLTEFKVDSANTKYTAIDGCLYNKAGTKLICAPAGMTGTLVCQPSLEVLGFGAFENSKLSEIRFSPDSNILTFGYRCFYNADNLKTFDIPASVVSVDYYAFAMCDNLETVNFAENNKLTGIYEGAFYMCRKLCDITLPESIVEISDFAFYGCESLAEIPFDENAQIKGIYDYAFAYCSFEEITIPKTVIDIGEYAFLGGKFISAEIPSDNAKDLVIGIGAFAECNSLEEITIPFIGASFEDYNVTWLGYIFGAGDFNANPTYVPQSLKVVTINSDITMIGTGAFYELTQLEQLNLPKTIVSIYSQSFMNCSAKYELCNKVSFYSTVGYDEQTTVDVIDTIGRGLCGTLVLSDNITTLLGWLSAPELKEIIIPDSVETMSGFFFMDCSSLKELPFPQGVKIEGEFKATGCSSLEKLTIPDSVEVIGGYGLSGITVPEIVLPDNIKKLDFCAFFDNRKLEKVTLPKSLEYIGSDCFYSCSSLKEVVIPDSVTYLGDGAFWNCYNLQRVVLSKNITEIKDLAFYGCSLTEGITIPEGVTSICGDAFTNACFGEITLPSTLKYITADAFADCYNLKTVINNSELDLTFGSTDNGSVALYADTIISADGSIEFSSSGEGKEYIENNGFVFETDADRTSYTLRRYTGKEDVITLPENINGCSYSIESFIASAKKVILPDTITYINSGAFRGNYNIEELVIPHSVLDMYPDTFKGSGITTLVIDEKNPCYTYEDGFIYNKEKTVIKGFVSDKTEVVIPNTVTEIKYRVFSNNNIIQSVIFEEGSKIAELPEGIFYYCTNLSNVVLPDTLTKLPDSAFSSCKSLQEINLPENLSEIGGQAFYQCEKLNKIIIPDTVTSIGTYAFQECESIESIVLPYGLKEISASSFYGCEALSEITIPDTVEIIGESSFGNCISLKTIDFPDNLRVIESAAFSCSGLTGEVVVPDKTETIGDGAFNSRYPIEKIYIPASVKEIGANTLSVAKTIIFDNNDNFVTVDGVIYNKDMSRIIHIDKNLTEIVIPATVTDISGVFSSTPNIRRVVFEDNSKVTAIEGDAFFGMALEYIKLPDSIESIGDRAFYYSHNLTIELSDSNKHFKMVDGCLYDYNLTKFITCTKYSGDITVPEGVTEIPGNAFYYCRGIRRLTLPSTLEKIGWDAFGSSEISEIIFKNAPTYIDYYAFSGACINRLVLPEGVETIETDAFRMSTIREITLPSTLKNVASDAFEECSLLKIVHNNSSFDLTLGGDGCGGVAKYADVIINADGTKQSVENPVQLIEDENGFLFVYDPNQPSEEQYKLIAYYGDEDTVTLPDSINGNKYKLEYVKGIKNVIVPDSFTEVNDGAFGGARYLESVQLPKTIQKIGYAAFSQCDSLKSINIPESVTYLGERAFEDCESLENPYLHDNLEYVGTDAFKNTPYYNDKSNWVNGCLNIGKYLVAIDNTATVIDMSDDTYLMDHKMISSTVLTDINLSHVCDLALINTNNIVTICLTENGNYSIAGLFNYSIPITLKNIVLRGDFEIEDEYMFNGVTGVNIYVEADKNDVQWDHVYPNWANGNAVYYGGEWITATFIGADDEIISRSYRTTSQIIRQPYVEDYEKDGYLYVFCGWDTDGDGEADGVPATSATDITAKAVYKKHLPQYWVTEKVPTCTENGYKTLSCMECDKIIKTVTLRKLGHTEAEFVKTTAPTCTEKGYDSHICAECGTEYHDNFTDAIGHNYGSLTVDTAPTCDKQGTGHRICANCGDSETETIASIGHNYSAEVLSEATCSKQGKIKYTCSDCGGTYTETTGYAAHSYEKKKTYSSFIEYLLSLIANIVFGIDNGTPYYYACTKCGSIMCSGDDAESSSGGASVFAVHCNHQLGEWETSTEATASTPGVEVCKCTKCGEVVESRAVDVLPGKLTVSPITGFSLGGRASNALRLNWTKNTSADGYIIEQYNGSKWVRVVKITNPATTTYRVTGLKAGTAYKFRMRAYKMDGTKALYSSYTSTLAALTNPSNVAGFKLGGRAADALRLNWTKNTSADGYIIEQYKSGKWVRVVKITNPATTTYRVTGLKAGTAYKFRMRAYKMDGTKALYSSYTSTLAARTNPSKVASFKLGGRAADALRLNWTKNTSADGYIVEQYKSGKWVRIAKITSNATTTYKVSGLKASTQYKFRVKAYKMSGKTALYSGYTKTLSAYTNPSKVANLKITGKATTALRLGWSKNTSADGYIVEMYKGGKWVRATKISNNATVTFRKSGLKKGTTYKFRIRTYNMVGKTVLYGNYVNVSGTTNN